MQLNVTERRELECETNFTCGSFSMGFMWTYFKIPHMKLGENVGDNE